MCCWLLEKNKFSENGSPVIVLNASHQVLASKPNSGSHKRKRKTLISSEKLDQHFKTVAHLRRPTCASRTIVLISLSKCQNERHFQKQIRFRSRAKCERPSKRIQQLPRRESVSWALERGRSTQMRGVRTLFARDVCVWRLWSQHRIIGFVRCYFLATRKAMSLPLLEFPFLIHLQCVERSLFLIL